MANQADYLAEYISAMEGRSEPAAGDLGAQLRQKENDLVLAAELGKALLEKNEALSMENERMAEDYSKHLEVSPEPGLRLLPVGCCRNSHLF